MLDKSLNYLIPNKVKDLTRLGNNRDAGYVVPISSLKNCNFMVSFGMAENFSMERDFLKFNSQNEIHMYDHTMLISEDDPEVPLFKELHEKGICNLRIVPDVSLEGSAKTALMKANEILSELTNGRARCFQVEARENDKNSAIYTLQ